MTNETNAPAETPAHHFFGSTAFTWVVDTTRAKVLERLAKDAGADIIKRNVKANGGLYAWTCRVEAPKSTTYDIRYYAPQGVDTTDPREFNLVNTKGHCVPTD